MLWLLSHLDLSKANLHRWKLGKAQAAAVGSRRLEGRSTICQPAEPCLSVNRVKNRKKNLFCVNLLIMKAF